METQHSRWRMLAGAMMFAVFALTLLAACGSSNAGTSAAGAATEVATNPAGAATAVATAASGAATGVASAVGSPAMNQAAGIAACLEQGTTAQVVSDLRAGQTQSAQAVYRGCLAGALPAALVGQLDPIINQAATCGSTAAKGLSNADMTAVQNGDQAVIQRLTQDTLTCVSNQLGVPLQ